MFQGVRVGQEDPVRQIRRINTKQMLLKYTLGIRDASVWNDTDIFKNENNIPHYAVAIHRYN